MDAATVSACMNVLSAFKEDAQLFFAKTLRSRRVTQDGAWGKVSWWNDMCSKYLKTGAIACGAGALASAAEFYGVQKGNIPAHIYIRLWCFSAESKYAEDALYSLVSLSCLNASLKNYIQKGPAVILEKCDSGKMSVYDALSLIEYLPPDDVAQNRLVEYVADKDEDFLSFATYLRSRRIVTERGVSA